MRHDPGKFKPLASKGVNKRWGLPPDEGFVAIPHVVAQVVFEANVSTGAFMTLYAILYAWDWRSDGGLRQEISVSGLAVLTHRGRYSVRRTMHELAEAGLIFVEFGSAQVHATIVDITPLRVKAGLVARAKDAVMAQVKPSAGSQTSATMAPSEPSEGSDGGGGSQSTISWLKSDHHDGSPRAMSMAHNRPYSESSRVEEYPDASGVEIVPSPPASIAAVIERQRAAIAAKGAVR